MNIEGSKLASLVQSGGPAEGRGQSLIDSGNSSSGFADALTGQLESFAEAKVQAELPPGQDKVQSGFQSANQLMGQGEFLGLGSRPFALSEPRIAEGQKSTGEVFNGKGEESEWIAAASMLTSLTGSVETEKVADALTPEISEKKIDSFTEAPLPEAAALFVQPQQLEQVKELDNSVAASGQEADAKSAMQQALLADSSEESRQEIGDIVSKARREELRRQANQAPEGEAGNRAAETFSMINVASPLPVPAEMESNVQPEELVNVDHSLEESAHKNAPQSFIAPLFEEFKSNAPRSAETSEEGSPKSVTFGQIIKEHLSLNESRAENPLFSEPVAREKAEPAVSGADARPLHVHEMADIAQTRGQSAENRADVPAISKPLAHPDWNRDLGERIIWMNNKDLPAAEIKLNPQHLGPISVRIEINNDQATIAFTTQHAAVRDALEASIPKLREMMSNQQVNLADVNISHHSSSHQQHQSSSQQSQRNFDGYARLSGAGFETSEESEEKIIAVSKGILSIYA